MMDTPLFSGHLGAFDTLSHLIDNKHNGQKKKCKRTKNDLQNIHIKN
jgi:hypothetical protein